MVTKPQPFFSFPLRRPEASFRTQDTLLDLFLDGAAGPEAEAALLRPPFGFGQPERKPLDTGVGEKSMMLLGELIKAEMQRSARTKPGGMKAVIAEEIGNLRQMLRDGRSVADRPPTTRLRARPGTPGSDAIFAEDQPSPTPLGAPGAQRTGAVSGLLSNLLAGSGPRFEAQGTSSPGRQARVGVGGMVPPSTSTPSQSELNRLMSPSQCAALLSEEHRLELELTPLLPPLLNEAAIRREEGELADLRLRLQEEMSKPNPDRAKVARLEEEIKETQEFLSSLMMAFDEANTKGKPLRSRLQELKRLIESGGCRRGA